MKEGKQFLCCDINKKCHVKEKIEKDYITLWFTFKNLKIILYILNLIIKINSIVTICAIKIFISSDGACTYCMSICLGSTK